MNEMIAVFAKVLEMVLDLEKGGRVEEAKTKAKRFVAASEAVLEDDVEKAREILHKRFPLTDEPDDDPFRELG